jgi:hypothetical protein
MELFFKSSKAASSTILKAANTLAAQFAFQQLYFEQKVFLHVRFAEK